LQVVNSLFLGDYLTSEGQEAHADLEMIADAGFYVLGHDNGAGTDVPEVNGSVALRRRGAGTALAPNA
jgi:biotin synthase